MPIIAENTVEWARVASNYQGCKIFDANGNVIRWGEVWKAKFPVAVFSENDDFNTILTVVAKKSGYHKGMILQHSRTEGLAHTRHLVCWIARHHFNYRLSKIAKLLNRHHTTILNSIVRFDRLLKTDGRLINLKNQCIADLERVLK